MNHHWIRHIYQQWSSGNSAAAYTYLSFVKLAAHLTGLSAECVLEELKKYDWFKYTE